MAVLLDLSNELLLQILESVTPLAIVSFATSCKRINTLAQNNLALHRKRIARYQNVTLWGCPRHQDKPHPILLLRDICNDWKVAYHARSLVIRCCGMVQPQPYLYWDNFIAQELKTIKNVLPKIVTPVCRMLSKALLWDEDKVNNILDKTEYGPRGAILGLLMVSLPAIRSITFKDYVWRDELWIESMKSITNQQDPHLGSPGPNFLKDVSELNLYDRETPHSVGMSCSMVPFVTLPSLRVIRGFSVHFSSFKDFGFADNHGLRPSPVTEINLQGSLLDDDYFIREFFRYTQVLKRFTYDENESVGFSYGRDPAKIIRCLRACASCSLESLALTGFNVYGNQAAKEIKFCVKDFKVLKEIHLSCDLALIAKADWRKFDPKPPPINDISRLVDTLPASVETVRLEGEICWKDMAALFVGLPEGKAECLPKLKEISFKLVRRPKNKERAEEWARRCQEHGIVLQLDEAQWNCIGRLVF